MTKCIQNKQIPAEVLRANTATECVAEGIYRSNQKHVTQCNAERGGGHVKTDTRDGNATKRRAPLRSARVCLFQFFPFTFTRRSDSSAFLVSCCVAPIFSGFSISRPLSRTSFRCACAYGNDSNSSRALELLSSDPTSRPSIMPSQVCVLLLITAFYRAILPCGFPSGATFCYFCHFLKMHSVHSSNHLLMYTSCHRTHKLHLCILNTFTISFC